MHFSLPLFNFTQSKDKCASYSFTTKQLTHSMGQVSFVVKYSFVDTSRFTSKNAWNRLVKGRLHKME